MLKIMAWLSFLNLVFICTLAQAKPEKIIIDADVGIDDAMAILLALASPEFEIVGISTVYGNTTINNATRNALYLVSKSGLDIPVAKGSDIPIAIKAGPPADFVHGKDGMGDMVTDFDDTLKPIDLSAADFIIEQSKRYKGELTLVPLGRLTNIARALEKDPALASRIKRVVLMGGAFTVPGNVTPVAEANILGDPHAADIVFNADWNVTAVGLDVTTKILVNDEDLAVLAKQNPKVGGFVRDICQFYIAFYRSVGVTGGLYLHDPSAILYMLQPGLFNTESAPVRVATGGIALGQTIAAFPPHDNRPGHWYKRKTVNVALQIDETNARQVFLQGLAGLMYGKQ